MVILYTVLTLMIVIFVLLFFVVREVKNTDEAKHLKLLHEFIPIYESIIDDFIKLNHDFNNHMATIQLMEANPHNQFSKDDIKQYFDEIESCFKWNSKCPSQDSFLMIFLSTWENRLETKGYTCSFDPKLQTDPTDMTSYGLFILLNRILQTLLDTSVQVPSASKAVYIKSNSKEGAQTMVISLSIQTELFNCIQWDISKLTKSCSLYAPHKITLNNENAKSVTLTIV